MHVHRLHRSGYAPGAITIMITQFNKVIEYDYMAKVIDYDYSEMGLRLIIC